MPHTVHHVFYDLHAHRLARTPHGRRDAVALPRGARAARPASTDGRGVLVKTLYLSLDPHARRWLNPESGHFAPIEAGDVMRSFGLGVVVEASAGSGLKVGDSDLVDGLVGWTEYGVHGAKALQKVDVPQGCDAIDLLGPLGTTGLAAYFGLFDVANLKAGETLVVSGAAGVTGNVVCQLAKRAGARVVASMRSASGSSASSASTRLSATRARASVRTSLRLRRSSIGVLITLAARSWILRPCS
ncbi:hypothetical protein PsYK624_154800 [Phanerochaete sordida]|uniref:Oxidoreductase N-terminal domain-containing protein n=1 Tax=Phanerochaete sordida TaxID=48140 RepID=A0A9P3GPC9_9APHY|nr:hypothetical protein PsYK624_154800 [Phanerochaete sordida]